MIGLLFLLGFLSFQSQIVFANAIAKSTPVESDSTKFMIGANIAPTLIFGTHFGLFAGFSPVKRLFLAAEYREMKNNIGEHAGPGTELLRTTALTGRWDFSKFLALKLGVGQQSRETRNYLNGVSINRQPGVSKSTLLVWTTAIGSSIFREPIPEAQNVQVFFGMDYIFIDFVIRRLNSTGSDSDYKDQAISRHGETGFGIANAFVGFSF